MYVCMYVCMYVRMDICIGTKHKILLCSKFGNVCPSFYVMMEDLVVPLSSSLLTLP